MKRVRAEEAVGAAETHRASKIDSKQRKRSEETPLAAENRHFSVRIAMAKCRSEETNEGTDTLSQIDIANCREDYKTPKADETCHARVWADMKKNPNLKQHQRLQKNKRLLSETETT